MFSLKVFLFPRFYCFFFPPPPPSYFPYRAVIASTRKRRYRKPNQISTMDLYQILLHCAFIYIYICQSSPSPFGCLFLIQIINNPIITHDICIRACSNHELSPWPCFKMYLRVLEHAREYSNRTHAADPTIRPVCIPPPRTDRPPLILYNPIKGMTLIHISRSR